MSNVVRDIKKEERVNAVVDSVVTYLGEFCNNDPFDDSLRYLKEEIMRALENYNDENNEQEKEEEADVQTGDQETICG